MGGAEVAADDLAEVDLSFLNVMRQIAGASDGSESGATASTLGAGTVPFPL
jgi:hypothetical protein